MGAARDNRVFHYAVLFSVAFHAFVLFGAPALKETSRRMEWPGPIIARLVGPAPEPAPRAEEPKPPEIKPPAAKPAVQPTVKPVPSPKPAPVVKAAPEAPSKPAPAAAVAPAPAAEPAPATPAPPSAASGAAATQAVPSAAAAAQMDADNVGRFRMLVIDELKRLKRYPRAARDNNWEGRTRLRVTYGGDGRRSSVDVVRSSGHELLDIEAVDTVGRTDVPVPPALRGKGFAFEVEMIFSITEDPSG